MKIVHVKWEDSHVNNGAWADPSDVKAWPLTIKTAGFLVAEDKKTITIASSVAKEGNWAGVIKIPKSCILKRKVIAK